MTALYHVDPYLRETEGNIVAAFEEDDGRFCVVLSNNLFYPQGGGQKGDRGWLLSEGQEYHIVDTVKDRLSSDGRCLSFLEAAVSLKDGQNVKLKLDWPLRYAQMRLHNIVHLHHCMMERAINAKIPNPVMSDLNHDGTAVNRYETDMVTESLAQSALEEMKRVIAEGAEVKTRDDDERPGYRYWECLGFVIPCGGTHLHNINEIGNFSGSVSKKKGKVRIDFRLS